MSKNGGKTGLAQNKIAWGFWPEGKPANMVRVALYARVSTHDQQTLPLQKRALRDYLPPDQAGPCRITDIYGDLHDESLEWRVHRNRRVSFFTSTGMDVPG